MLIEEKHLFDTVGNTILRLTENFSDVQNGCTVNSQLMFDYIKTNYPKYNITWSTTRGDQDINDINRLSKDDFIVLDYNHNHNYPLLAQLKYP